MINRAKMPRQLRNKGGITNVTPRTNYFLGGIKRRIRKLIPNELADIAVKAAPFVAPFNPGIAAAMRGIGRFDQRGSISDAFKQAAGTYIGGQGLRMLGGAGAQENFFGTAGDRFTSPLSSQRTTSLKNLFQKDKVKPFEETANAGKKIATESTKGFEFVKKGAEKLDNIPIIGDLSNMVKQQILVGGVTTAGTYIYEAFLKEEPPQQESETYEEYMARRKENVGRKMKGYFDNYFKFDKEYSSMSESEKQAFIDRVNVKDGGRIKYQTGGITMANTLAENIRRNVANQAAVAQQFERARKNIPQKTDVQEYAMGEDSILGPLSKKAASTIMEGQDKSQAALNVLNQTMAPTSAGEAGAIITDGPNKFRINADGSRTMIGSIGEGIMTQTPTISTPTPDVGRTPTTANNLLGQSYTPGALSDYGIYYYGGDDYELPIYENISGMDMRVGGRKASKDEVEKYMLEQGMTPSPNYQKSTIDPMTDQDIMEGYAKFKEQNPGAGMGAGLQVMINGVLPDGTPLTFNNSAQASAFNQYLESIGQPPFKRVSQTAKLTKLNDPMMTGFDYSKEINWSPGQPAPEGYRVVNMMGDEFLERKFPSKQEIARLPMPLMGPGMMPPLNAPEDPDAGLSGQEYAEKYGIPYAKGGRVRFSEGANLKIKLKQIGYEDTLLDTMSLKELRELLDSEKGTFTDQGTYREPAKKGGMPTGIMKTNKAGVMERDYRDKGGFVPVGIKEKADDVPAMLSKNEFVMTANAVRGAGNGSIEKGAQRMYDTMKRLEKRVV